MVEARKPQFRQSVNSGIPKPQVIPGMGTLPFRPGQIAMTPLEKKNLAAMGWKEGDPIPANLANLIAEQLRVQQDVATATPLPLDAPAIKMPTPIDISTLPIEKQKELQNMMQMFKTAKLGEVGAKPAVGEYSPSVMAAIEAAAKPPGSIRVVDSRKAPEEPKATKATPEPELSVAAVAGGRCPRCDWDLKNKVVPEPTPADILSYQAGVLGDQPFQKEYRFFGDRLRVIFRDLTIQQAEQCLAQANRDMTSQPGGNFSDLWRHLLDYRLCLSLVSYTSDGIPTQIADAVDVELAAAAEAKMDAAGPALPTICRTLQSTSPLHHESIWRLLNQASQQFMALIEKLEAKAGDLDFYKPVEQAP